MAANITRRLDGRHEVFVARKDAWHLLGNRVDNCLSGLDAMTQGLIDYTVGKRVLHGAAIDIAAHLAQYPGEHDAEFLSKLQWINDHYPHLELGSYPSLAEHGVYGMYRDDTDGFLGVVGENYTPIQIPSMFAFSDAVLGVAGKSYESAGSLFGGSVVFCSAALDTVLIGGVDQHKSYLNFVTSHDGSIKFQGYVSDVRQVCWNTLQAGLRSKLSDTVLIKHTRHAQQRLDDAQQFMTGAVATTADLYAKLTMLSERMVSSDALTHILNDIMPFTTANTTRTEKIHDTVLNLYERNDDNAFPEFRGTAYNLLNAITEYTDHMRGTRATAARGTTPANVLRAESAILGTGAALKDNALERIMAYATDMPMRPRPVYSMPSGTMTLQPPVLSYIEFEPSVEEIASSVDIDSISIGESKPTFGSLLDAMLENV